MSSRKEVRKPIRCQSEDERRRRWRINPAQELCPLNFKGRCASSARELPGHRRRGFHRIARLRAFAPGGPRRLGVRRSQRVLRPAVPPRGVNRKPGDNSKVDFRNGRDIQSPRWAASAGIARQDHGAAVFSLTGGLGQVWFAPSAHGIPGHRRRGLTPKRQRAGALQNASRDSVSLVRAAASWTAAAPRRFGMVKSLRGFHATMISVISCPCLNRKRLGHTLPPISSPRAELTSSRLPPTERSITFVARGACGCCIVDC